MVVSKPKFKQSLGYIGRQNTALLNIQNIIIYLFITPRRQHRKTHNVVLNFYWCCNPIITMLNNGNFGFPYSFLQRFSPPAVWCHDFHSRDFHPCMFATSAFFTPAFSVAPKFSLHYRHQWSLSRNEETHRYRSMGLDVAMIALCSFQIWCSLIHPF